MELSSGLMGRHGPGIIVGMHDTLRVTYQRYSDAKKDRYPWMSDAEIKRRFNDLTDQRKVWEIAERQTSRGW